MIIEEDAVLQLSAYGICYKACNPIKLTWTLFAQVRTLSNLDYWITVLEIRLNRSALEGLKFADH